MFKTIEFYALKEYIDSVTLNHEASDIDYAIGVVSFDPKQDKVPFPEY
jgi:hypothetical protein